MGASIFAFIGAYLMHLMEFYWQLVAVVTIAGFMGMVADSILGSRSQRRYMQADGTLADVPSPGAHLHSGKKWMSNDLVNLISNAMTTGIMLLVIEFIYSLRSSFAHLF